MKVSSFASFLTFAALLIGCSGSGNNESDDNTNVRFFNAVPDLRSVDFLVDSDPYFPRTGYLEGSGYFTLDTDPHQFGVVATGSFTSLASRSIALADDRDHTLLVLDEANDARLLVLTDDGKVTGT